MFMTGSNARRNRRVQRYTNRRRVKGFRYREIAEARVGSRPEQSSARIIGVILVARHVRLYELPGLGRPVAHAGRVPRPAAFVFERQDGRYQGDPASI
jgi:hypothetical protein